MAYLEIVGQAGATRWPSGKRSAATLNSRIRSQHLSGRITTSTFRLTLTALLYEPFDLRVSEVDLEQPSKRVLSTFIANHLSVTPIAVEDADALDVIEADIVRTLDPPLNLSHVDRETPSRQFLSKRRRLINKMLKG